MKRKISMIYALTSATVSKKKKSGGAASHAATKSWFERFRNKDFSLKNEKRYAHPTVKDSSELTCVIESGPSFTKQEMSSKL